MRRWHNAKGWRDVGYQYFIRKDGTVEKGRDELDVNKFTFEQFDACAKLIDEIRTRHDIKAIIPHNFTANKSCPVFNIVDEIYPRLSKKA